MNRSPWLQLRNAFKSWHASVFWHASDGRTQWIESFTRQHLRNVPFLMWKSSKPWTSGVDKLYPNGLWRTLRKTRKRNLVPTKKFGKPLKFAELLRRSFWEYSLFSQSICTKEHKSDILKCWNSSLTQCHLESLQGDPARCPEHLDEGFFAYSTFGTRQEMWDFRSQYAHA